MNLEDFIKFIDTEGSLNYQNVVKDISFIALTNAIAQSLNLLSTNSKEFIKKTNQSPEPDLGQIISIFEKEGKLEQLNKNIAILSEFYRNRYIKFQYDHASEQTKNELIKRFPIIIEILKSLDIISKQLPNK